MIERTTTQRVLDVFLAPDNDQVADRVIEAALATVARTPQRRAMRVPWRFTQMHGTLRLASAALVAVVAVGGVAYLLGSGGPGATATPSPTLAPSPNPTATVGPPAFDAEFSSPTFGYDARVPLDWRAAAGTTVGSAADLAITEPDTGPARYWDHFNPEPDTAVGPTLVASSTVIPPGMTEAQWIAAYQAPQVEQAGRACIPEPSTWEPVSVDGRSGGIYVGCKFAEVLLFVDDRVFIFGYLDLSGSQAAVETSGRRLLEAFIETVSLDPDRAAAPSPAPS